jgi:hypothetical protein
MFKRENWAAYAQPPAHEAHSDEGMIDGLSARTFMGAPPMQLRHTSQVARANFGKIDVRASHNAYRPFGDWAALRLWPTHTFENTRHRWW